MNIAQLLELQKKKNQLQNKKESMLKKQLKKKRLEQINIDNSGVKKGYIQKTKIIEKKKYQTIHEKARRNIPIQIQNNASVCNYLINNENYKKIYQRTKQIINLSQNQTLLNQSIAALKAYGQEKFEKIMHLKLIFQKQINCGTVIRPFKLDLPNKNLIKQTKKYLIPNAILLVKNVKKVESSENFKNLIHNSLQLKEYREFVKQFKSDKKFKKTISQNRVLILCDWQIYQSNSNKFIDELLQNNFTVFPLDINKVPYFYLKNNPGMVFESYLQEMIQNEYCLIKTGKQHNIHLKLDKDRNIEKSVENIKEAIIQVVSKLIERNKDKFGNYLVKAEIKTNTSLNFCIYEKNNK